METGLAELDGSQSVIAEGELRAGAKELISLLRESVGGVLRGKERVVELALTCMLAEGHLLIEDVPGVGKTTLARALAKSISAPLSRIQFTSDMLPADIVGVSIYEEKKGAFDFHPGPIFNSIVLADEINRASPRTQSALLEAMHEGRVTVEGSARALPRPFLVVATQNPLEYHGTYPLPESQLDRFLLRISVGYPDATTERELLASRGRQEPVEGLRPVMAVETLRRLMDAVHDVHVTDELVDYLMMVARATRESPRLELGVSTRALLSTLRAARARALVRGRGYVVPDDFDAVLVAALSHRVRLGGRSGGGNREEAERVMAELVQRIPRPD